MSTPGDIVVKITLHPNGQLAVEGPLDNKVLFFGIIELAKTAVQNPMPVHPSIVVPRMVPKLDG